MLPAIHGVVSPTLAATPFHGLVGALVTLTGTDFNPADVSCTVSAVPAQGLVGSLFVGPVACNRNPGPSNPNATFVVPNSVTAPPGNYILTMTGSLRDYATAVFTVDPIATTTSTTMVTSTTSTLTSITNTTTQRSTSTATSTQTSVTVISGTTTTITSTLLTTTTSGVTVTGNTASGYSVALSPTYWQCSQSEQVTISGPFTADGRSNHNIQIVFSQSGYVNGNYETNTFYTTSVTYFSSLNNNIVLQISSSTDPSITSINTSQLSNLQVTVTDESFVNGQGNTVPQTLVIYQPGSSVFSCYGSGSVQSAYTTQTTDITQEVTSVQTQTQLSSTTVQSATTIQSTSVIPVTVSSIVGTTSVNATFTNLINSNETVIQNVTSNRAVTTTSFTQISTIPAEINGWVPPPLFANVMELAGVLGGIIGALLALNYFGRKYAGTKYGGQPLPGMARIYNLRNSLLHLGSKGTTTPTSEHRGPGRPPGAKNKKDKDKKDGEDKQNESAKTEAAETTATATETKTAPVDEGPHTSATRQDLEELTGEMKALSGQQPPKE